jgi:hypothetical protein
MRLTASKLYAPMDRVLYLKNVQKSGLTAQNLAASFAKTVLEIDSEFSFIPRRLL